MDPNGIIERATLAFESATGLRVTAWPAPGGQTGNTLLEVIAGDRVARFVAEIRSIDRFQTLDTLQAKAASSPYPPLLVAPYVTAASAEHCRELHLAFMDEAGNAYLEAPGLFVWITGRRRPAQARAAAAFRALTAAGLRIIFALLRQPDLATAPYREIAGAAGVALGTVGGVLADLERRGFLAPEKPGPRRLLAPERLLDEWVTHYPIKLRPKLKARRFTAPSADWWMGAEIHRYGACWGGEVAADRLTGYLKPEKLTIYVAGKPDALILAHRLRPDIRGEIEILEAFWSPDDDLQAADVAPPLLVYGDLMASADPRNIETAKLIHDRYLAPLRHPA